MGLSLELVRQRLELQPLARLPEQGRREQPVGEPGVAGEERAVEVRPEREADSAALVAALAVVSKPCYDATERLRAGVEICTARVVLEARERAALARP